MNNKLVYIEEKAYWKTYDGNFEPAEIKNGKIVEHIIIRSEQTKG